MVYLNPASNFNPISLLSAFSIPNPMGKQIEKGLYVLPASNPAGSSSKPCPSVCSFLNFIFRE